MIRSEILNKIGIIEERLGMVGRAVGTHRAAGEGTPDKSFSRAIRLLVEQGRADEAVEVARQWTGIAPNSGAAWNRLGFLLQGEGRFEEAIEAYSQSIAIGDSAANQARYRRGQCRFEIRDDARGRADMWATIEVPKLRERAIHHLYENLFHRGGAWQIAANA